ncbi:hypothetical protein GCM10011391_01150 [Pullulanibacillus camelliae]|uniref:Uncharacterized protein n=1 Tax=Pullulanibacillus camelliae TaxID=1707096 RepID=A0A8J2VJV2_9BACL|nr:hypothetical protein GCM10011391_01150 [Pullulanibacillus camelliae]
MKATIAAIYKQQRSGEAKETLQDVTKRGIGTPHGKRVPGSSDLKLLSRKA